MRTKLAILLTAILLVGNFPSGLGHQLAFAADQNDIEYDPYIGESVNVAPNFKLNPQEGETFAEGYIKFDITDPNGYISTDKLFLPDGEKVTLSDGSVLEVNGDQILLDGVPIASVNSVENGDGQALKIDLSAPLANGNFEKPLVNGKVQDWTINTTSTDPNGNTLNQIWLDKLASKTQSTSSQVRSYQSFDDNGDGTYTVTGPGGYTYKTDVNYKDINKDGPATVEGQETLLKAPGTLVNGLASDNGTSNNGVSSLELGFKTGQIDQKSVKYGSVFRVDAWSTPFKAKAGDQLSFDWRAFTVPSDTNNYDDYEVYGFIVDQAGKPTEILYGRGKDQPWTTVTGTIPADGTYQFRFVSGSFDETDGGKLGATLRIDNARVVSTKVVEGVVDAIAQLVQYKNSQYSGNRPVKISVVNSNGQQSSLEDSNVTILMSNKDEAADMLGDNLTIETPANEAYIYDPTQKNITGSSAPNSTVDLTVKNLLGDTAFNGTATTDSNGKWSIDLNNDLIKGGYTIQAIASKGGATSNPKISTFTFVDKADLEDYYNKVKNLKESDYRAGWEDDETDGDIEFASALQVAKNLLTDIANATYGLNLDQAAVDQALADLQNAKSALEKYPPVETEPATYEHGKKEITIDFNKNVKLTAENPTEGFTVMVDGNQYNVINAVAHGDKVTLTVNMPLDSDAQEVTIDYLPDSTPNLYGDEDNGTAVEHFTLDATDDFGQSLQIKTTKGTTDDQTPQFTGTVHSDTDEVTLTIFDSNGTEVLTKGKATLNGDGTWTYVVPSGSELAKGDYTIEVTANDNESGRTVTKSTAFTVVDKLALQKERDEVNDFVKEDYRAGWENFTEARNHANEVLAEPTSSQEEVDQALVDLQEKRDALEKYPPVETTPATYEHGKKEITIVFDKNIKLTRMDPTEGFTVTVDGKVYNVTNAVTNGDKVTLTVDQSLDSDAQKVTVEYTPNSTPNLYGDEENGTADEHFIVDATDAFGKALQVITTKGNTDDQTPHFTGTVHVDADEVLMSVFDNKGTVVLTDVKATLNSDGVWSYTVPGDNELAYGDYTYEVTAKDNESGRTVMKSAAFTVVNKTSLQNQYNHVSGYNKKDYRAGWDDFVKAREQANKVLANPTISQEEVDKALANLRAKRGDLQKHEPKPVNASFDHGNDQITISFDKDVKYLNKELDPKAGFKVTINDKEIKVIKAELVNLDASGKTNKVKLTLAEGTELSSDANVIVFYSQREGNSNLFGDEENGTKVEDFTFKAGDPFGHALKINKPDGITNDTTPRIEGNADRGSDSASITITGPNGDKVLVDEVELTIKSNGTWTFDIGKKLEPGEYIVKVTTSKVGHSDVTKFHNFVVVDKENLIDLREDITNKHLVKDQYTEDSWDKFELAYDHAKSVIEDPDATQVEVDKAATVLGNAYYKLVFKKALKEEVKKSSQLKQAHYSKESWEEYHIALVDAQKVLQNPEAMQEEIDKALNALERAYKGLTVDKSLLIKEHLLSKDLVAKNYSEKSWSIYEKALKDAEIVISDSEATQDQIDEATALLEKARKTLAVDKQQLNQEEILSVRLVESDYTKASWNSYQKALEHARSLLANPKATQSEIDEALKSLRDAKSSLVKSKGENLPNTATNTYNWLLMGVVLVFAGFTLSLYQRKKRYKER